MAGAQGMIDSISQRIFKKHKKRIKSSLIKAKKIIEDSVDSEEYC